MRGIQKSIKGKVIEFECRRVEFLKLLINFTIARQQMTLFTRYEV